MPCLNGLSRPFRDCTCLLLQPRLQAGEYGATGGPAPKAGHQSSPVMYEIRALNSRLSCSRVACSTAMPPWLRLKIGRSMVSCGPKREECCSRGRCRYCRRQPTRFETATGIASRTLASSERYPYCSATRSGRRSPKVANWRRIAAGSMRGTSAGAIRACFAPGSRPSSALSWCLRLALQPLEIVISLLNIAERDEIGRERRQGRIALANRRAHEVEPLLQELAALEQKLFRSLALDSVDEKLRRALLIVCHSCQRRVALISEAAFRCGLAFCPQQQDRFHVLGNARPGDDETLLETATGGSRKDASLQYLRRAPTPSLARAARRSGLLRTTSRSSAASVMRFPPAPSSSEALAARLDLYRAADARRRRSRASAAAPPTRKH